ncbi:DoxX family membrane protein [Myxococcus stipitatus]|uniref:MauE/DoxX family redox-associated membrane protein n=1 Tax=Myxococcus stipitatus TaxID=83455 RepID=UPI001F4064DB|nr:MauE/DoxX family redox-associated membrane protein [Myxococcus stipitatus]MCE9669002.1 DoxX family membrane protein [Myxococcus stipitatus]
MQPRTPTAAHLEPPEAQSRAERTAARVSALDDRQLAHGVLRLVLGLNILTHGLVRVAAPGAFADSLVQGFTGTPLPEWTVRPFALVLPFVELAVGLLILLGLRLRLALVAGGALIAMLTFGESLRQQWNTVGLQLLYALAYFVLLSRASDARLTLDGLLAGRRTR